MLTFHPIIVSFVPSRGSLSRVTAAPHECTARYCGRKAGSRLRRIDLLATLDFDNLERFGSSPLSLPKRLYLVPCVAKSKHALHTSI